MLGNHAPITPTLGDPPPTEFRIFKRGDNTTIDGKNFIYDGEASKSVMGIWKEHATPLHIDFEHASEAPADTVSTQGAPAQGWFDLEDREDGLWAVNVRWLDPAKTYISEGKYRLFSPVFEVSEEGRVLHLRSLGLTNLPRLDGLTPLVQCKVCHCAHNTIEHEQQAPSVANKESQMAKETTELASDKGGMSLEEHAKALHDHLDESKDMHAETKDMHSEHMKALKDLTGALSTKAKAKDEKEDESDDNDDDDESEEAKMKNAIEACKGALDAAIGKTVTPAEAKEFKAKLDKGEVTPEYVTGYVQTAKALPTATVAQPAGRITSKFSFEGMPLEKAKAPSATEWKKDHKALNTPADAEAHLVKVCKASNIDAEKVAKEWADNLSRYETYKELGLLK